jgi:hypothetical protein
MRSCPTEKFPRQFWQLSKLLCSKLPTVVGDQLFNTRPSSKTREERIVYQVCFVPLSRSMGSNGLVNQMHEAEVAKHLDTPPLFRLFAPNQESIYLFLTQAKGLKKVYDSFQCVLIVSSVLLQFIHFPLTEFFNGEVHIRKRNPRAACTTSVL